MLEYFQWQRFHRRNSAIVDIGGIKVDGTHPVAPMRCSLDKVNRKAKELIPQMVRRIAERFHPEQIILFGSHARGVAGPDSDVDLLVVMPLNGTKHQKQVEIRLALREFPIPKDIIVTTPDDFAWRKKIPGTIEHPALREGRVLYARK